MGQQCRIKEKTIFEYKARNQLIPATTKIFTRGASGQSIFKIAEHVTVLSG